MKTIAVLTSGGDSPGMNPAIRGVVRTAVAAGMEVIGVRRGYAGLIEGDLIELRTTWVSGIIREGGTKLLTARSEEFKTPAGQRKGAETLKARGVEGLVVIGGNGSAHGAYCLHQKFGIATVLVPSSIDNDLAGTDVSIGFQTAVNTAVEAIDKIRDTAVSHDRVFVVEVMGREAGFLALEVALAGGAEHVLIPEIPFSLTKIGIAIKEGHERGKVSSIIVVAEGRPRGSPWRRRSRRSPGPTLAPPSWATCSAAARPAPRTASSGCGWGRRRWSCWPRARTAWWESRAARSRSRRSRRSGERRRP